MEELISIKLITISTILLAFIPFHNAAYPNENLKIRGKRSFKSELFDIRIFDILFKLYKYLLNLLSIEDLTYLARVARDTETTVKDVRLPSHLRPISYNVSLVPFIIPDNYTIRGSVIITLKATIGGARNITVHSADTDIDHDSG